MHEISNDNKINLKEVFRTLGNYKWLITLFTLIAMMLMLVNLYFKPSIYSSTAIVEVKTEGKKGGASDFLMSAFSSGASGQIDKEIELLKTFSIHDEALKKVDFRTKYYKTENYKEVEVYKNKPIEVVDVEVFDEKILGKKVTLIPTMSGFKLKVNASLKEKIVSFITGEALISLDGKSYLYGEEVKSDYFKFVVNRKKEFKKPIQFKLYGLNRQIYDKVIVKNLNVMQINKNAPLIKISYQDNVPKRADAYVNAITQSFIDQSINNKNEQNNKILKFINHQLEGIRETLGNSEDKLESYRVKNKVVEPTIQAETYIKKLSEIEVQLSENLLKKKLIENLISYAQHNQNLDAIAPSLIELNDKPTLQLISELQKLQLEAEDLSTEFTEQHPKVLSISRKMYNIRKKILRNIRSLKINISQTTASLKNQKTMYNNKIKGLPTKEKRLVNIKRDYEVSSSMYNFLLKKKTETEMVIVATLSDYKIIDHAHTASIPVKPKRTLMMIIATILGLLLSSLIAFFLNGMNNKIKSREDLEALTDLPLYGIIPQLKLKERRLEVYHDPQSPFTESYRSLRTNLQFSKKSDRATVILTTSTIAGEGKTTITSNLASVFQMAGYKTIIINLDMRKPTLHNYFDIINSSGMSTYLSGKDTIQDIIFATKYENLHVIPAGTIPSNPSELILSDRLNDLLDILKERYDYIFIDSSPVGLVSDTIHLMKQADLNLIVFRENYAEKSFVSNLKDILDKNNFKNVGMVLNSSSSKNSGNAYGYGYGYGERVSST
jgi:capsular exopolysaccharide synthesis family protein